MYVYVCVCVRVPNEICITLVKYQKILFCVCLLVRSSKACYHIHEKEEEEENISHEETFCCHGMGARVYM